MPITVGDAVLNMTANTSDFVRDMTKVQKKMGAVDSAGKLKKGVEKIGTATKGADEKFDRFGRRLGQIGRTSDNLMSPNRGLGKLMKGLAGFATIGVGFALAGKALGDITAQAERGAAALKAQIEGLKSFVQVSEDFTEFERLKGLSKKLQLTEGLSADKADELVFAAKSISQIETLPLIGEVSRIAEAVPLLSSIGKFTASFKEEAGTPRQLINKFLAAAAVSDVTVQQIAPAVIPAAQPFNIAGFSDEELLAIGAIAAKAG